MLGDADNRTRLRTRYGDLAAAASLRSRGAAAPLWCARHRRVEHQPQIRVAVGREGRVLVFDVALARMAHALDALAVAIDIVLAPPARELGACLFETAHQLVEGRIVARAPEIEAEARDDAPRVGLPVEHDVAIERPGEEKPERVAFLGRKF